MIRPAEPAAHDPRRDRALDLLLVVCLIAWGQSEVWNGGAELLLGPPLANATLFAAMSVALSWRRSRPLLVLTVQCALLIAEGILVGGTSESLGWLLPLVAGVYAVSAHATGRPLRPTVALVAAVSVTTTLVDSNKDRPTTWTELLATVPFLGLLVGAWLLGSYVRARRLYTQESIRSAELASRASEEHALRTAAESRNRIAHELHDVLAHGLTVSVMQAEAGLARIDANPDRARASLEAIAAASRSSLADVRRLVLLLREPDAAELGPAADLRDIPDLVSGLVESGLRVEVELPEDLDLATVPAGLALATHRIVQESLTNALRHGHASQVRVSLTHAPGTLVAEIADNGVGHHGEPVPGGGLTGMRERVAMFGGTLSASSVGGHGFVVRATLPWDGVAE